MHDKTKANINRKVVIGLLAAIFGLTAFLFLTPQSVGAVGYGWTGYGNSSGDCSGNLSRIKIETRERFGAVIVNAGSISAEIRELSDDSLVDTVTGSERETATSGCVFDPFLHYVRVTVTGNSLYHSVFTEFKTGDPNFFKSKSINFFTWVHEITADPVVEHSEPADGVWLNYNPEIKVTANDVFVFPDSGGPTQIERVILEMQGPTYITKIFDKDSTPPGPWNLGIINLGSQATITPGWYQWGVFLNDREGFNANVSGWSGIRSFGYDIQAPDVSCSIAYNPGTGNIDVVLNETDALSGIGEGQVHVKINGGSWTFYAATTDDFSYPATLGNTYKFQYAVRDNTVDSSGNPTQWTAFEPCGSVTPGAPTDSDLIITSSKDSAVPTNSIISAMNPPSYNGGRFFDATQPVTLRGWVRNVGTDIADSAQVKVCFFDNWTGPDPPELAPDDCSGANETLVIISPALVDITWGANQSTPFGTACADVDGNGYVQGLQDFLPVGAWVGKQYTDPDGPDFDANAINYDMNDDGLISPLDVDEAIDQIGIFCPRLVSVSPLTLIGFTTSATNGNYQVVGWVDSENLISPEENENNNQAIDSYEVFTPGDFNLTLNPTSRRMSKLDQSFFQTNIDWNPGEWQDNTQMTLEAILPPSVGMSANFGTTSGGNPYTFTKGTQGGQPQDVHSITLYIDTDDTPPGDYTVTVKAIASQPPSYTKQKSQTFTIYVREADSWINTGTGGNVGSLGDISSAYGPSSNFSENIQNQPVAVWGKWASGTAYFPLFPGLVGPNGIYLNRTYMKFDTSAIPASAVVVSASFSFEVGSLPSPSYDVELIRNDWTIGNWVGSPSGNIYPFNTGDLPPQFSTYTISDINSSDIVAGGETKYIMKYKNEPGLDLFSFKQPTLAVVYKDPNDANAEYLVIANGLIDKFNSSKGWLVKDYSKDSGGLQYGFSGSDVYDFLWQKFGSGRAVDHLTNGQIPSGSGVFKYNEDFTYTGSSVDPPSGTEEVVFFINGDMNIKSDLILPLGKRVVFVVNGSINIRGSGESVEEFPVVSYRDGTNSDLKILRCGDANCTSGNSITSPDTTGSVGWWPSMTLDSSGFPVVSYYDSTNDDLKILHCGSADCTAGNSITSPDTAGNVGKYTSIVLDGDGFPVVSYYDAKNSNKDLKILHCGDANCSTSVVNSITTPDTGGDVGQDTSIVLDGDGFPVVSYYQARGGELKILHCGDANCSTSVVNSITSPDAGSFTGSFSSIVLDGDGFPVVSYRDADAHQTNILHCGDANCTSGNSITSPNTGEEENGIYTSIVLDGDGFPVVSYWETNLGNMDLKILHCGDANCSTSVVNSITTPDTEGDVGRYNSIVLDSDGFPVVSYRDETNRDLKILHCGDANCSTSVVNSITTPDTGGVNNDSVGRYTSIALATSNPDPVVRVDGFFVANGKFKTAQSLPDPLPLDCPECQLTVNGAVVAFGGFDLLRDVGNSSATIPSENFLYDPSYLYYFSREHPTLEFSLLGKGVNVFKEVPP